MIPIVNKLGPDYSTLSLRGQKIGLDIYYAGSDDIRIRVGSVHVNDGILDFYIQNTNEYSFTGESGWAATWQYVLINKDGNITLSPAIGTSAQRPTDSYFQWGEYGGTGYNHIKQGYYHDTTHRIIGALYRVSATSYYIINMGNETDETGENSLGEWTRDARYVDASGWGFVLGNGTTTSDTKTISLPVSASSAPYHVMVSLIGYKTTDPANRDDITGVTTAVVTQSNRTTTTFDLIIRGASAITSGWRLLSEWRARYPWR